MEQQKPKINLIAAVAEQTLAIGAQNGLLWKIPADLQRFKAITFGHPVVMGRKTFNSIGRPLPGRANVVIARQIELKEHPFGPFPNTSLCYSIEEGVEKAREEARAKNLNNIFIIGGGEIYRQTLPLADKLYLTIVHTNITGDTFFPDWRDTFKNVVFEEKHLEHDPPYTFVDLVR